MWNLVTSNRLLGDIQKINLRKKHLQRLKNIKASINNRPPKKPDTFQSKNRPKIQKYRQGNQLQQSSSYHNIVRNQQIQSQNAHLLKKMVEIDNKPSRLNPIVLRAQLDKQPGTVSLNRSLRWKQLDQIYQQNQRLIAKIISTESVYNRNKWEKDFVQNTYYGDKIKENSGEFSIACIKKCYQREWEHGVHRVEEFSLLYLKIIRALYWEVHLVERLLIKLLVEVTSPHNFYQRDLDQQITSDNQDNSTSTFIPCKRGKIKSRDAAAKVSKSFSLYSGSGSGGNSRPSTSGGVIASASYGRSTAAQAIKQEVSQTGKRDFMSRHCVLRKSVGAQPGPYTNQNNTCHKRTNSLVYQNSSNDQPYLLPNINSKQYTKSGNKSSIQLRNAKASLASYILQKSNAYESDEQIKAFHQKRGGFDRPTSAKKIKHSAYQKGYKHSKTTSIHEKLKIKSSLIDKSVLQNNHHQRNQEGVKLIKSRTQQKQEQQREEGLMQMQQKQQNQTS